MTHPHCVAGCRHFRAFTGYTQGTCRAAKVDESVGNVNGWRVVSPSPGFHCWHPDERGEQGRLDGIDEPEAS